MLHSFYETYYQELYIYIYTLSGRHTVTEDILQETFLKAFTALKDSHTNIRAWLYMVARNLYFNYAKKERHTVSLEAGISEAYTKQQGTADADLLENVIQEETKRELWQALRRLSVVKREILLLQYFGGFSQKQIAAMLRLSQENVRVLAHRAKKELKKYLEVSRDDLS